VAYEHDPVFNVDLPSMCPDVPSEVLQPRATWGRPAEYDAQAAKLAGMFVDNFRAFEGEVVPAIKAAGPRVG
jgi:phosphoenolpyruvate carboxykinase (ATP)